MDPRWSPDGSRIAFSARARGATGQSQPFRIYTIAAHGGKPTPVPGVPGPAFDPSWSPDGKRLAFAPYPGQARKEQQNVSIVNVETGGVQAVPGSEGVCYARWSPDGNWLAAATCDKVWPVAYNFNTQKWSELRKGLTTHSHWSKDSRYIYGGTPVQGQGNRLIRIEVATGKVEEIRRITEFPTTGIIAFVPFWTPDDEPIVLKDRSTYQIYRIERDR
jgi:Tol biopolymer transport system component